MYHIIYKHTEHNRGFTDKNIYVPSSGVWRVTTVLKGPIPTDVDAAIIQK